MSWSLQDLAKKIADIDFTMLTTRTDGGALSARPMSNNGDVEYDGDSWFFSEDSSRGVADIEKDPNVGLTLQGKSGLLGKPPIFIGIEGKAELIRDIALFVRHWNKDMERWWPEGPTTPGIVLIKVHAQRVHYWDGEDQGEVKV